MATQDRKHVADATGVSPSPAGPPGSCPLYLLHLSNLSFMIGMPNRCCILELRTTNVLYATSLVCLGAKAGSGTPRPKTISARDSSAQIDFSTGTPRPGTPRPSYKNT